MVTEKLSIISHKKVTKIVTGVAPNKIKHPWEYPMATTPDMITLANNIIRNTYETDKFIDEIEGPTQVKCNASCCNTL